MSTSGVVTFMADKVTRDGKNNDEVIKDKNGNYLVSLGAFNTFNTSGQFYPFFDVVSKIFTSNNSPLINRMVNRNLKGECNHPIRLGLMDDNAWSYRVNDIAPDRVSHNILGIDLIETKNPSPVRNNYCNKVIDVVGHIIPDGPFGPALEDSLNNPKVNTAFSVRCFGPMSTGSNPNLENPVVKKIINKFNIDPKYVHRMVFDVITYDWVAAPGIATATTDYLKGIQNKLKIKNQLVNSEGVNIFQESHQREVPFTPYFEDFAISQLVSAVNTLEKQHKENGISMESYNRMKELITALEDFTAIAVEDQYFNKMAL